MVYGLPQSFYVLYLAGSPRSHRVKQVQTTVDTSPYRRRTVG